MDVWLSIINFINEHPGLCIAATVAILAIVIIVGYHENPETALVGIALFLIIFLLVAASDPISSIVSWICVNIGITLSEKAADTISRILILVILGYLYYVYKKLTKSKYR